MLKLTNDEIIEAYYIVMCASRGEKPCYTFNTKNESLQTLLKKLRIAHNKI